MNNNDDNYKQKKKRMIYLILLLITFFIIINTLTWTANRFIEIRYNSPINGNNEVKYELRLKDGPDLIPSSGSLPNITKIFTIENRGGKIIEWDQFKVTMKILGSSNEMIASSTSNKTRIGENADFIVINGKNIKSNDEIIVSIYENNNIIFEESTIVI